MLPYSPGILEQTSAALDAILSFSHPHPGDQQLRVDSGTTVGDKPHLLAVQPEVNLREGP
jgi:hypothetical protein